MDENDVVLFRDLDKLPELLVLFDSLASLETTAAENVIKTNKAKDGADGYAMQYRALCDILETI